MALNRVFLSAPHYVLGEIEADHATIGNLHRRAEEFRMLPAAELWGWGNIRRTERSLETLAIESGSATLRTAVLDPESIDALVLCSTKFPGGAEIHGRFVQTITNGIGLGDVSFIGLTLNRCTNFLAALDIAAALVVSGRHRRILVITTDRVEDEETRMENFALFSDGAASCVVSDEYDDQGGYELVSCASAQDTRALDWSNEISADLSCQVNDRLLGPLGMVLGDVSGLMHANLFKPLIVMKERQAGFTSTQMYTDNVERIGHCFAADPLINLVDRAGLGQLQDNCYYMLASSVPGSRIGVLLRKIAAPAAASASDMSGAGPPL